MKTDIDVLSDRSKDLVNNYEDKLKNSVPPHLEVEWPLMNQNQLRRFLMLHNYVLAEQRQRKSHEIWK